METLKPEDVLKFLAYVNNLKHSPRRGWELCKVQNHEQVAGHMYSMAMMTFLLGNNSTLDRLKCLQLALVHDLAESIVGDITPHDNVPEAKKHEMEDDAMKEITGDLGETGKMIYDLYKEYEAKETAEAKFVKDLDRFDLLFTASQYEKRDNTPKKLQEFFDTTKDKFQHPFICKLVNYLELERNELTPKGEPNTTT